MTTTMKAVGIGEMVISDDENDVLVAYGLGSCVAICLYDPTKRLAAMIHRLLPAEPSENGLTQTPGKFVDRGVPMLIEGILKRGASRSRLIAHMCGGANMLNAPGFAGTLNIGQRNVAAAEAVLAEARIPLRAKSTGGTAGRTVKLFVNDGQVTVRTAGAPEQPL